MYLEDPIFAENKKELRKEIRAIEHGTERRARLWRMMKRCARTAPLSFPWYTPIVALITEEEEDIRNAKQVLHLYLQKLEPMSFYSGLQYHFWCFAFPHAKWAIYFQWLCTLNAYTEEERKEISGKFLSYQFLNFYSGMNTKPDPECVDNQTLSLALSCTLIGYLFSRGEETDEIAELMYRDGLRRLPGIIGAMPKSGYSGEGSTYMDCVNAPAIPLSIELLSRITGDPELFWKEFEPNHCRPVQILEATARAWMPGGLQLPWDNYGYQYGTRSAMAYAAAKTGKGEFFEILEKQSTWSYDVGIGWAYDDLPWTLIWWPLSGAKTKKEKNWYHPEVGGILESKDSNRYLMQMWDDAGVGMPARMHVNPNAVILNGYGIPLSADGVKTDGGCERFCFEDTYREVGFLNIGESVRYNYGDGCAGAHSVILLDNWEGMRVMKKHPQRAENSADLEKNCIYSDVTPVYREHWSDVEKVARKSSLCHEKFFLIEDYVKAEKEHTITSRFLLRPELVPEENGIKIRTPEGVTLHLLDVLGCQEIQSEAVEAFPKRPEEHCVLTDFNSRGKKARRLFLAFISNTIEEGEKERNVACISDPKQCYSYEEARELLKNPQARVDMEYPAYMEANLPVCKRWWYHKTVAKQNGESYLVLPRGLRNPALWINGKKIDLEPFSQSEVLIRPHVKVPEEFREDETIDIVFMTEVAVSHYEGNENGMTVSLNGGMAMAYPCQEEVVEAVRYTDGMLEVQTNREAYRTAYELMEE